CQQTNWQQTGCQQPKRAVLYSLVAVALFTITPSLAIYHTGNYAKADAPGAGYYKAIKTKKEPAAPLTQQLAPEAFNDIKPTTANQASGEFYIRPGGGLMFGRGGLGWGVGAAVGYQFFNQPPRYKNSNPQQIKDGDRNAAQNAKRGGWQIELGAAYQQIKNNRSDRLGDENYFAHFAGDGDNTITGINGKYPNFLNLLPNPSDPNPFVYTFNGITDTGSKTAVFFGRNRGASSVITLNGFPTTPENESPLTFVVHNGKFTLARSNDPSGTPIDLATLIPEMLAGTFGDYDKSYFKMSTTTRQQLVPITLSLGYRFPLSHNDGFYLTPRLGAGVLFNSIRTSGDLIQQKQYNYALNNIQHSEQQWVGLLALSANLDYQVTPHFAISVGAGVNYVPTGYITTPSFQKLRGQINNELKAFGGTTSPTVQLFQHAIIDQRDLSPLLKETRSYVYGGVDLALQFSF
ncbi:MAG: hypothetical protein ORN57_02740, partial [Alphaproteobacteria bacterium]|nr:hypothetical protein [Alphaproteobacteria bacterium]